MAPKPTGQRLCHFFGALQAILSVDPMVDAPEILLLAQELYEILNDPGTSVPQTIEGLIWSIEDVVL